MVSFLTELYMSVNIFNYAKRMRSIYCILDKFACVTVTFERMQMFCIFYGKTLTSLFGVLSSTSLKS